MFFCGDGQTATVIQTKWRETMRGFTKLIPFWSAINHARNRRRVLRCLVLCSIAILSLPFETCKSGIEYLCDSLVLCFC